MTSVSSVSSRLTVAALALGLSLIGAPLALVLLVPAPAPASARARPATGAARIVPPTLLPSVDPVVFRTVEAAEALRINAAIPFSTAPNPRAAPFRFSGSPADLERAQACLAAAMLYEAGDDREAEQSVGQVVLNRVRHPAFPDSVCGVVFQGSERATGCQFTFTCDGAFARRFSDDAWRRALGLAGAALAGAVYAPVGHATHYHTNWVVPYWSSSLDKIVEVKTHLFFRWTGWWGTPPAFRKRRSGVEPVIPQLAERFPVHASGTDAALTEAVSGAVAAIPDALLPRPVEAEPNSFVTAIDRRLPAEELPQLAARACGDRPYCKFLGWTDPAAVPVPGKAGSLVDSPALATMSFSYLRDRSRGFEKALWNCDEFLRPNASDCMLRRPAPRPKPALPVNPGPDPAATPPPAPR
ncbi:cell wall hydrolase [Sphingomonas sp. BGYR3]|uniref:cell wall hydrolase n=1 Tax=Sphingomonas sp. BGYR3 TaxID=2975483 RepID=UPI0021A7E4E1|nr:cell wall hydrolase [Sphingomonas sp. BGYR3]MDG5489730.1 cell wall hydrolase [Sphingomonas sp. BGYR3]